MSKICENCIFKVRCNQACESDTFCIKQFKLNKLFDNALISEKQRQHVTFLLDKDESDLENFKYLSTIEKNIENFVSQGGNLYIHSKNTGNGKTSWALRLVQSYFHKIWFRASIDRCCALFINVPRYLLELKENISQKSDFVEHIKNNVLDADVVIWDEVGTKGLTQFEHENILNLINARLDLGKANIYTSNLNDNELHEVVGDRLYSRIVLSSDDVELYGLDKRAL